MNRAVKRTTSTVAVMLVVTIVIVLCYFYWANRTEPIGASKELSEAGKLLERDLVTYYPETPKEVTKVFASMMKALYNNPQEDEVKPLALKIRQLYDKELLDNNPEADYLNNIITDLADWKKHNRTITNFLLIREDEGQKREIDGVIYATKFVSYTIQENRKFTEVWRILLRQDSNKQWKILGWQLLPQTEN